MQAAYDLLLVIADVIAVHCPGTSARGAFTRACFLGDWEEAQSMVEGMLAEPWVLRGNQEARLREFLVLLSVPRGPLANDAWLSEGFERPSSAPLKVCSS